MKHLSSTSWLLSTLVPLFGCGGGERTSRPNSSPPSGGPAQGLNGAGNWQFSTTSMAGMPPATIAGSIAQSGVSVSGAVHVDGSSCFDHLTTVGLSGTLTGKNISLTSSSIAGQVTTFTGSFSNPGTYSPGQFAGTYTINGGCANGDQGNVTGVKIPYIANILNGTFTGSGGGHSIWPVTWLRMPAPVLRAALGSPEAPLSLRPASVRRPSRLERFPPAASSSARLWPL